MGCFFGWIHDNHQLINDLATPLIALGGTIAVLLTFGAQRKANKLQRQADQVNEINRLIETWQNYLQNISYKPPASFSLEDVTFDAAERYGIKALYDFAIDLGVHKEHLLFKAEYVVDQFCALVFQAGYIYEQLLNFDLPEDKKKILSAKFIMSWSSSFQKALSTIISEMESISKNMGFFEC